VAQNRYNHGYQAVVLICARWLTDEAAIRGWPALLESIRSSGTRQLTVVWWLEQDSSSAVQVMVEPLVSPSTKLTDDRDRMRRTKASLRTCLRRFETDAAPTLLSLTVHSAFVAQI